MNEIKKWYDYPKQVCFTDYNAEPDENGEYYIKICGIAWHDKVICACCGRVLDLEEIADMAPYTPGFEFKEFEDWVDFSEYII